MLAIMRVTSAKVHIFPLYLMMHVRDGRGYYKTLVDVRVIHRSIMMEAGCLHGNMTSYKHWKDRAMMASGVMRKIRSVANREIEIPLIFNVYDKYVCKGV